MTIELDQDIASRMNDGVVIGGGIQLPFQAPVIWVMNGNSQLKALANATYYGGFGSKREDMQFAQQTYGKATYPHGFSDFDITASDGKTIQGVISRTIMVTPLGIREGWLDEEGLHATHYFKGSRHHVQALVLLASKDGGKISVWSPAVITAKGFQAKNLLNAFSDWTRHTALLRSKIAPNIPAWAFYLVIGTFGSERKQQMVGGTGKQSAITPIGAFLPEGLTEATLESLFVGKDVANLMVSYMDHAKEWLTAWSQQPDQRNNVVNGDTVYNPEDENEWIPSPSDYPTEEIPF